jgi:hypothetical protein
MIRMVVRMIRVSRVRMIRATVRMIREGPDGPGVGPDDPAWGFTYGCLRGSYPDRPGRRPDHPGLVRIVRLGVRMIRASPVLSVLLLSSPLPCLALVL